MKRFEVVFLLFLVVGCDFSKTVLQPPQESLEGVAKLALVVPNSVPRQLVQRVAYQITGHGIADTLHGTMSFRDDMATTSIVVPAGRNRVFRVYAYGEENIITYLGRAEADVSSEGTTQVDLVVNRRFKSTTLVGRLPRNTTNVELTITGSDVAEDIVVERRYDSTWNEYHFDCPTGKNIVIRILAYESTKDKVTAQGEMVTTIYHDQHNRIEFSTTSTGGNVELIGRFQG